METAGIINRMDRMIGNCMGGQIGNRTGREMNYTEYRTNKDEISNLSINGVESR